MVHDGDFAGEGISLPPLPAHLVLHVLLAVDLLQLLQRGSQHELGPLEVDLLPLLLDKEVLLLHVQREQLLVLLAGVPHDLL